ncbi:unnamed protein product [Anisakis simplex]|uniref:Enoyl-CoA delta isomerase 2, mitochondrial (inferred by orthology to a human protein) n=1 Tax=Anisakis simplex TaxID=6269 RepID=A0A0M3K213_ANISI|nr:unnamed protein product [Anisakis simplex]
MKLLTAIVFLTFRCLSSTHFEKAQADLKKLHQEPSVDVKLKLYALYKQATLGDASGKRPSALDFAGRAKFDAWNSLKGTLQGEAQEQYSQIVNSLLGEQNEESGDRAESKVSGLESVPGVNFSKEGKIFKIELNRPEKYNAITIEMYQVLTNALEYSSKDTSTSITVFTGTGDYFCSGNDLSNFARVKSREDMVRMADEGGKVLDAYVQAFINHEKPLVALINGPAIGISVTLLALCDVVIASDKATFHTPFATLGQSPEGCSTYTFPILMGHLKAAEVLLFGRKLTALEAMERNLVNQVIPASSFLSEASKLVTAYSNLPPESLRLNKQILRSVHKERLLQCNKHEVKLLTERWLSEECMQAILKFMKRKN